MWVGGDVCADERRTKSCLKGTLGAPIPVGLSMMFHGFSHVHLAKVLPETSPQDSHLPSKRCLSNDMKNRREP